MFVGECAYDAYYLFHGRKMEVSKLLAASGKHVKEYHCVYGGRQSGKTSLLLYLRHKIVSQNKSVYPCWINFQLVPGACPEEAFRFMARQIVESIPQPTKTYLTTMNFAFGGLEFDRWLSKLNFHGHLVVLLEELGAPSETTRLKIVHVLRAMFNGRFNNSLERILVIIFGGIELYDLAFVEVSPLKNVCAPTYLSDLNSAESSALLHAGFAADLHETSIVGNREGLVQIIYDEVSGHPYLTQRMGQLVLDRILETGTIPDSSIIRKLAELMKFSDPYLSNLVRALSRRAVLSAANRLVRRPAGWIPNAEPDEMEQLELIGVAKRSGGNWAVRNRLIERRLSSEPQGQTLTSSQTRNHVFISYCHENKEQVYRIRDCLTKSGENVWWDEDILSGQDLKQAIRKAMDESYAVLLCISAELIARERSGVFPEISDAIEIYRELQPGEIFIIPVRLSDCRIPLIDIDATRNLRRLKYVDLFPSEKWCGGLSELLSALRAARTHP